MPGRRDHRGIDLLRRLAFWLAVLAGAALAGPAQAATGPQRIEAGCRIETSPEAAFSAALAELDRCAATMSTGAVGTVWIDYPRLPMLAHAHETWRLLFDNHRVDMMHLYLLRADGTVRPVVYDPASPARDWASAAYFSIRLQAEKAPITRIVVRLDGAQTSSLVRAPKLMRARDFAAWDRNVGAIYGIAVGMLALTILFHLSLFFAIRRRFQLYYCAHAVLLLVYALSYSSLILLFAPGVSATMLSQLMGVTSSAACATGTLFIIDFLPAGLVPQRLRRWAKLGAIMSLIAALLMAVGPASFSRAFYVYASLAATQSILLVAALLLTACWRKSPTAALLLLGWAPPIGFALLFPLRNLGLMSDANVPDGAMLAALTFECLILSLPIALRLKALRLDSERAHERHDDLERQALTDSLTGLANRRGFRHAIERIYGALAQPARTALLIIDIDHFKRVNDRYGHGCGDAILAHVANRVATVAGPGAIVSRYGGEEFLVVLRDYDLVRAGALAERLRVSVGGSLGNPLEAALPHVSVSIGVAAGLSDDIDRLIGEADRALYRAKNEGRNRVALEAAGQPKLNYAA